MSLRLSHSTDLIISHTNPWARRLKYKLKSGSYKSYCFIIAVGHEEREALAALVRMVAAALLGHDIGSDSL